MPKFYSAQQVEVFIPNSGWFRAQIIAGPHFSDQFNCLSYRVTYNTGRGRFVEDEFAEAHVRAIQENLMYA